MAEEQKRKLEIPWATVLPIVAALAGILAQYRPLVSSRPAPAGAKVTGQAAAQDVDARLWQDPLSVVQKPKADLEERLAKASPTPRTDQHSLKSLARQMLLSAADKPHALLVLPVMLDSGPYLEQAESRLRARQAVMEALSEADFIPVDGEHIGFVFEKQWPSSPPDAAPPENGAPLFFAWEECKLDPSATQSGTKPNEEVRDFQHVFVLWLPAARFNPTPLLNLATLLQDLKSEEDVKAEQEPKSKKRLNSDFPVRLIGPANSDGLQAMIREVKAPNGNYGRILDRVKIFSARATASDEWLTGIPDKECHSLEDMIEEGARKNEWAGENFEFHRTIVTDDIVLRALVEELKLRQIHVGAWQEEKCRRWHQGDHIVILSEWDSAYGRALAHTFRDEALKVQGEAASSFGPRIEPYRYMHGIDGRLPGDSTKEESHDDSAKKQESSSTAPAETTEGSNQSDFLRRLADSLKEQENEWLDTDQGGIRAIGILGSDIYDKLMVLRALRPVFANAIFFTNNYDAHFERPDEWDDTHNLIIASPFSGAAAEQKDLAPFRDNNQTSMYVGTLTALGKIADENEVPRPHIFEVGRNGVEELVVPATPVPVSACSPTATPPPGPTSTPRSTNAASPSPSSTPAAQFTRWVHAPGRITAVVFTVVGLILLAGWIILSRVDRRLSGGGDSWQRLKRAGSSTAVWLLFGVPLIIMGVALFATTPGADLEPLKFVSGISIWPSEIVRLIALLLAVHFIIKARVDLESNQKKLVTRFQLGELPAGDWHWKQLHLGLHRWHKEHPQWMKENAHLNAREAWMAYLRRNQFWPRFLRITALVGIYAIFAYGVFKLFPFPIAPARGDTAFALDQKILFAAVLSLMVLTFYVVDAIRLTSNLIGVVTGGVTQWEAEIQVGSERVPPLTKEELARYYDIAFVAERTEVVSRLIWYPLIVLSLMILARSAYFDNWTWPYSLLLILCVNALWAFGAAYMLRRAAELLRAEAIGKLQALRIRSYKDRDRRDMFDDLIAEIRSLKRGAFAPLSEQPFVRAILAPFGVGGLLAVGQRLLQIF